MKFNDEDLVKISGILFEDEWLYFELVKELPKTKVYAVRSKCSDITLGWIKWHPPWRHYCFFPTIIEETVHSDRCLVSISWVIAELNGKHHNKPKKSLITNKDVLSRKGVPRC